MRNLKKILALVLALMMTLSLMVTASAGTYKDTEGSKHETAVEVMSAIGVFNGAGAGSFNPTGTLQRDQAAKIIAYMMLGPDQAAKLPNDTGVFSDVGNYWASGPIAYCYSQGIIDGVGGGKFSPKGTLTGYQFGKMLLNAAGFEGKYTGANWQINVATALNKNGFMTRLSGLSLSKAITREQACQMALNALLRSPQGTTYEYTVLAADETLLYNGDNATAAALMQASNDGSTLTTKKIDRGSLAATVFNMQETEAVDSFGRPIVAYEDRTYEEDLRYYSEVVAPIATFTGEKTESAFFALLGRPATATSANVYSTTDGEPHMEANDDGDQVITPLLIEKGKTVTDDLTMCVNGTTTSIYFNGYTYSAFTVTDYLAQVTKVTPAKAATATTPATKATVTLTVFDPDGGSNATGLKVPASGFAKGDYVTINIVGGFDALADTTIRNVTAAKKVTGTMTAYTTKSVTVDGTRYPLGDTADSITGLGFDAETVTFNSTYDYFLGASGAILGCKEVVAAPLTEYVYVKSIQADVVSSNLLTGSNVAKAEVVFTNGTSGVIDLALTKTGSGYTYSKPVTDDPDHIGEVEPDATLATLVKTDVKYWFAYSEKDGKYTLKELDSNYAAVSTDTPITMEKGKATDIGDGYITGTSTKVVGISATGVTTFTGLGVAEFGEDAKVLYTYSPNSKIIANVYAVDVSVGAADAATYAYAVAPVETIKDGIVWTFVVDGKVGTYTMNSDHCPAGSDVGTVWTLSTNDGGKTWNGTKVEDSAPALYKTTKTVDEIDKAYFTDTDDVKYYFANNYKVYNVSDPTAEDFGKEAELEKDHIVTVVGTVTDDRTNYVSVVFITGRA